MNEPQYSTPATLEEVLRIKEQYGADARVVAGGTDLILRMRDRILYPAVLLDLRHLSLDRISVRPGEISIGASVTHADLMANADIVRQLPALVEACKWFAGPPIRNRATVAGNIVNASPAADLVPPLVAYDASVVLMSSSGRRVVALSEFFTAPGRTVLKADEILHEVVVPRPPEDTVVTFTKLGQRQSMAISTVNISTRITLGPDGRVSSARIVIGSVAPTVFRALAAEAVLNAEAPSVERIAEAARSAGREISPISDVRSTAHYRRRVTEALVRRALTTTWHQLRGATPHV